MEWIFLQRHKTLPECRRAACKCCKTELLTLQCGLMPSVAERWRGGGKKTIEYWHGNEILHQLCTLITSLRATLPSQQMTWNELDFRLRDRWPPPSRPLLLDPQIPPTPFLLELMSAGQACPDLWHWSISCGASSHLDIYFSWNSHPF